jgi:hypothetical protein
VPKVAVIPSDNLPSAPNGLFRSSTQPQAAGSVQLFSTFTRLGRDQFRPDLSISWQPSLPLKISLGGNSRLRNAWSEAALEKLRVFMMARKVSGKVFPFSAIHLNLYWDKPLPSTSRPVFGGSSDSVYSVINIAPYSQSSNLPRARRRTCKASSCVECF